MEVSSVSPPSASPTEGADLCEIDVPNMAIHSVTLLICLCGLAGNGAVLRLLTLQGRIVRIFDLAAVDFIFLLLAAPSTLLFLLEDVSCSPIMPLVYVSFLFQLSMMSCYWGLFRLARLDVVSDMRKLLQLCRCHPPLRLLWVMGGVQYCAFFALFTVIPTVTFLCPLHEQEHCRVALTSMFAVTLLIFAAPVVITRTIDIIKAKRGSQQQKPKKRDTVIFLIVLFILFLNLWNILQQLGFTGVSSQVFFLLACITSTIKPLIYFLVGRCWKPCSLGSLRLSLQRVFEERKDITPTSKDTTRDMEV
ncbi:PREDICTED: mas-related G-protein coupled receptor member H isoform X1 [Corvus brachyrhynchos]|uniref:mas-related G-protein coupled receptor member H isoform X1 n=1 Tax=Corvus brachyrhynchos TaxID=85066 RepID=UPI0008164795|nr:PREDICTED: mas-related G-protein coupled receptor member H isoform X1 [Corvus brachyrhynchos]